MDMGSEIQDLYEKWLLNTCKEIIHNDEDLNDLWAEGYRYDDFIVEVKSAF